MSGVTPRLVVVAPGLAVEEPCSRAMRELGLSGHGLERLVSWPSGYVSSAVAGRYPLGRRRVAVLSSVTGIDFSRPVFVLRCGLWLREGVLSAEQRVALRAAVSREVALRRQGHLGARLGEAGLEEFVVRRPSAFVGGSDGYLPWSSRDPFRRLVGSGVYRQEEEAA